MLTGLVFTFIFALIIMFKKVENESIILFINSSKRSSGITPQFTINLTRPITQIKSFEILGVEVPYSFYNIRAGNVGIGRIGTTEHYHGGRLTSRTITDELVSLVPNLSTTTLMIKIDGAIKQIRMPSTSVYPSAHPVYDYIIYAINHSGLTATVSIVNYRLIFNITAPANFSKMGFYLDGTTFSLASYMGLTQDTEFISLQPTNTAVIQMPAIHKIFNSIDTSSFTYSLYSLTNKILVQAQTPVNGYTRYSLISYDPPITYEVYNGTITIDTEKHYMSYICGFTDGNYTHMQYAPNKITIPIKPPIYYDNNLMIDLDGSYYAFYVPDGYYTPSDLAATLTSLLSLSPELSASTVTVSSVGIFTINIQTATPHSSIGILKISVYGWLHMTDRIGFTDSYTVGGTNITNATFVGSKTFDYKHKNLYIKSTALGQLINGSSMPIDDPTYQLDNVIHKIQINTTPGNTITDNKKYSTKKYVTKALNQPITQLDFSLYDDDSQLVQLNGRSWSIGIKITF